MGNKPFNVGCQPCDKFKAQRNDYRMENRHECYATDARGTCGGTVSFCEACASDHHLNGWDTCNAPGDPRAATCKTDKCRERHAAATKEGA